MTSLFVEVADRFLLGERQPSPTPRLSEMMIAVSKAVDFLEGRPPRHGLKVAAIAGTIAQKLGLDQRDTTAVTYAALLHDVGLARVVSDLTPHVPSGMTEKELFYSHALLNAKVVGIPNDRRLSDTALTLLGSHAQAAGEWVDAVHLSADIKEMIACHHELCDGSGYPHGLSKENIPIGGRILAFADVVEGVMQEVNGLTSRKSAVESFLDIKANNRFDPEVIRAFRALSGHDDFLRQLFSLDVEEWVHALITERTLSMAGATLLDIAREIGRFADRLVPYTHHHSERVARYALKIAHYIGVNQQQLGELAVAALVHDIGKVAVPMSILKKSTPLNEEETTTLNMHPHHTEEILKGISGFQNIITWASEHHEAMNGRGFPCRKKGFEISLGGRIIAVADAFDVLTTPRPDRPDPFEPLDALPILGQGRHRLYDNEIVSILRKVILDSEVVLR